MKEKINMEKNETISKQAFGFYKKNLNNIFSITAIYGTIILLLLLLAYFFPISLIFTIPLIAIPFTFALQSSLLIINNVPESNNRPVVTFFKSYASYYNNVIRGGYRSIIGLIKGISAYALIYVLVMIPIGCTAFFTINELQEIVRSNATYTYEQMELIINNNDILKYGIAFAQGAALLAGSYFFIHHVFAHSLIYSALFRSNVQAPMNNNKYVYRYAFSYFKSTFYKQYYKAIWWLIIIYVLGYCLGFGAYLFVKVDILSYSPQVVGLASAFILSLGFLPYVFYVIELILLNNMDEYDKAYTRATINIVNSLKTKVGLSKEEEQQINDALNRINNENNKDQNSDK